MREENKIYITVALTGVIAGVLGGFLATSLGDSLLLVLGVAFIIFYLGVRSIPFIFDPEEEKTLSERLRSNLFGFLIGWIFGLAFAYSFLNPPDPDKFMNQTQSLISFLI